MDNFFDELQRLLVIAYTSGYQDAVRLSGISKDEDGEELNTGYYDVTAMEWIRKAALDGTFKRNLVL